MIPIKIELTNFQSYSQSSLDFNFPSALIIGELDDHTDKSNGAGKSTILESIAFALYGKSRQANADGVVKRGADFCEVNFIFEHNGAKYRVNRKRNSRFSRSEVLFWKINENGTEEQIAGDTNGEINEHIKNLIKSNYEVFINSSYFMQKSISDFVSGTTSERQKIISSILNLERWNKYMKEAATKASEYEKLVGQSEFRLKALTNVAKDLAETEINLKSSVATSDDLNSKDERLSLEIAELEKKLTNLKLQETGLNDYHDSVSRLDNVRSRIVELRSTINEKNLEAEKIQEKIAGNENTVLQLVSKIQEISSHIDLKNQIDLPAIEKELIDYKTKHSWFSKQAASWRGGDLCKCCGKPWTEHLEKVAEQEACLKECKILESRMIKIEEKAKAARIAVEKIKQTEIEIEKYTGRKKALETNNEISLLKKEMAVKEMLTAKDALIKEEQKEKELADRISGMQQIADSNTFEKVRLLLRDKKIERETTIKAKNEMSYLVGGLVQKGEQLKKDCAEKLALETDHADQNKQFAVYNALVRSFGRNGIQSIIIDNVIEELTKVANEWLNQFCYDSTYVRFITQKKDTKGGWKEALDIEVIKADGVCDFESLSGGEAFRVAFAIRLALSQIQARRMGGETQILLLDEVSSSLDKHGLEMFVSIIRKLEKTIKVLVITHDDSLKDQFAYVIKVKKTAGSSSMSVL